MHGEYGLALKQLNLKSTPKRLGILDVLAEASTYLSPEEVWQLLQERCGSVGLPTVYRNLEELANGGVIAKVLHPNRQLYYFFCPNDGHHHHFVCLACRRVADVSHCGMAEIEREVVETVGGRVLSHIVQVNGLCGQCVAASADEVVAA